ncbi:MAG: Na+/H+ antiporter subunit E [Pirellulales bacterium]|nr:Na+/H+ antiporter subunit E [Pirellulales bacterium]
MLLLNIVLAITWAAINGEMSLSNLTAGFVIGYAILWIVARDWGKTRYFTKAGKIVRFSLQFLWELLVATLRVALDIVTPKHLMKPSIVAIPMECSSASAAETTMLANVITLTPGTLTLDVSPDGSVLYVHAMYAADIDKTRKSIQEGLGKVVHEVFE